MGLAEVTMKHRELGTKKAMIERNMLVEEWEHAYEQDEWLTVRFPKMKDLKSNDGDAASPLEMISNGRISRSMITTELQNFVPVGQLCHVKAQNKSKGSNLATVCRSELAVAVRSRRTVFSRRTCSSQGRPNYSLSHAMAERRDDEVTTHVERRATSGYRRRIWTTSSSVGVASC